MEEVSRSATSIEVAAKEASGATTNGKRRGAPSWIWILLGILIPAGLIGLLFLANVVYIPQLASVPVTTPAATLEGARLLVTVSEGAGSPVAGALVQVQFGNISRDARTDELGEARFPDLPQNSYSVTVSHADHTTWNGNVNMTESRVNTRVQLRANASIVAQNEDEPAEAQVVIEGGPGQAPETQCEAGEIVYLEDFEDGVADNWREGRGLDSGWAIESNDVGGSILHVGASPSNPSQFALLPNIFSLHFAVYLVEGNFHLAVEDHFFTSESMGLRTDSRWRILSVETSFNGADLMVLVDGETVIEDRLEKYGFKKWVALEGGPGSDVYFDNFVACER